MGSFVIIGGALALIGGVAWLGWMQEKKRKEAMQAAALALGFSYSDEESGECHGLPVFERGRARRARNVLTGETAGNAVTLMDYQYTTGSGKNSQTHRQTIAVFPQAGTGLPDFELGPENFLHRLGQVFGYQDIDFEEDPEFSKAFLLRGSDEKAIRRTFTASVRAACGNFTEWNVQCRGGRIAAFRSRARPEASEIPSFLANALRIVTAIKG